MATEQANKEFARRWNEEIFRRRNLDAIDDFVSEEFVMHDPSLPEPVHGPEGVRDVVEMILSAFPDMEVELESVVAEGDLIAVRNAFTGTHDGAYMGVELESVVAEGDLIAVRNAFTGTHDGAYMGIEPTGEEIVITVVTFQRIEDDQLVKEWQLVDRLRMFQQLGVVEPPGE